MAERIPMSSRESDSKDLGLDIATGIGVVINIGHQCSHFTTSNSATGSHTRNIHLVDGGSNNHVGNDAHNDSTAISGTIYGSNLAPYTRDPGEFRARSVPLTPRLAPDEIANDSPSPSGTPPSFSLTPPSQTSTGRPRSGSALFSPHLQGHEIPKPRSNSLSALAQAEARPVDSHPPDGGPRPYTATHSRHTNFSLANPPYIDRPPHQDVAIQHIHCEPEASMQTDWIDSQLLGRVIELSAGGDSHLDRRTMVVMAVSTGARFLQCLHICRHPEMLRDSAEFYETHVAVAERRSSAGDPPVPGSAAVVIDRPDMYALRKHCYINYQHVWTVRRDVIFRNIGSVDDFQRLKHNFREAQKRLYEDG